MNIFLAHFRLDSDGHEISQTVCVHCQQTADYAAEVLRPIGLQDVGIIAGLLHDVGKLKPEFQVYLREQNGIRGSVDHSSCGMQELLQRFHGSDADTYKDVVCEIIAYAVAAHHGLMDVVNSKHENGFFRRLTAETAADRQAKTDFLLQCVSAEELSSCFQRATDELVPVLDQLCNMTSLTDEVYFYTGLLTRLVLSAVIEGDRRDTVEFMNAVDTRSTVQANISLWEQCLARVEKQLASLSSSKQIDMARKAISEKCREGAALPCGVYRLNVPTGGGKTLSCLRFSLAHAAIHGKKRIIFTSPLLSILDQNAQVIRSYIQDESIILEHHSNIIQEETMDIEQAFRNEIQAESWSAPIIITTLVQLLNTLFDGKSSCIRRFHALCDSVIVIDEVQTVPMRLLSLFNLAVNFLSSVCHSTILLCSATQPCSEYTDHPISVPIRNLVPYDDSLWRVFRRTEIIDAGRIKFADVSKFAEQVLTEQQSLLIVCNTKAEASSLFYQLEKNDSLSVFHLSAGMCMAHRRATLKTLETALTQHRTAPDNFPKVVCISTQVIEAGVDISFDSVIRFAAGMDSVIQAAGRCNRSGEREGIAPVYIVRCEDESLTGLTDIQSAQKATLGLLSQFNVAPTEFQQSLSSDSAVRYFYRSLYRNMPAHTCDAPVKGASYTLYQLLSDNSSFVSGCNFSQNTMRFYLQQAFQTAGQAFEVFDEDTTDVLVSFGLGAEIAKELNSEWANYDLTATKKLLDKAKPYVVSLHHGQRARLEKKGAIYYMAGGSILVLDSRYYDDNGVGVLSEPMEMEFNCI